MNVHFQPEMYLDRKIFIYKIGLVWLKFKWMREGSHKDWIVSELQFD